MNSNPPIWTDADLRFEKALRLAEDVVLLGPRPGWWRPRARAQHDRAMARLMKAHESDLRAMLAAHDPKHRAILARLIGWRAPAAPTVVLEDS